MTPEAQAIATVANKVIGDERFAEMFRAVMEQASNKPAGFAAVVHMILMKVLEEVGVPEQDESGESALYGDDGAAENILGVLHQVSRQVFGVAMTKEEFVAALTTLQDMANTAPQGGPEMGPSGPNAGPPAAGAPQPGLMQEMA